MLMTGMTGTTEVTTRHCIDMKVLNDGEDLLAGLTRMTGMTRFGFKEHRALYSSQCTLLHQPS